MFVTFEESPADLRVNIASLGFDVAAFEADGRWAFVDASAHLDGEEVVGDYQAIRLSLKGHPVRFLRERLARAGAMTARAYEGLADGRR